MNESQVRTIDMARTSMDLFSELARLLEGIEVAAELANEEHAPQTRRALMRLLTDEADLSPRQLAGDPLWLEPGSSQEG